MHEAAKLTVTLDNVGKAFFYRWVFAHLSAEWSTGTIVGISGKNGAGKSTLLRLITGIFAPTEGKISIRYGDRELYPDRLHPHLGFVAPYLQLYTELTPMEHLALVAKLRGLPISKAAALHWLEHFDIAGVATVPLSTFSSGMLQRFRLALAMVHRPPLLCLDEPSSNLDHRGKQQLRTAIEHFLPHSLILIASNDPADLALCSQTLVMERYHTVAPVSPDSP